MRLRAVSERVPSSVEAWREPAPAQRTPAAAESASGEIRVVEAEPAEVLKSGGVWAQLLEASGVSSFCLQSEWLGTWLETYLSGGQRPCVLLMYDGDRLVGGLPLLQQRERGPRGVAVNALRFLATGEPEHEEVASEYLDIVALPGYERRVAREAWRWFTDRATWDVLCFENVLADSLIVRELAKAAAADGAFVHLQPVGHRFAIRLPATWDAYLESLPSNAAKRMLYKRRKWLRSGGASELRLIGADDLEHGFAELARLHRLRWERKGHSGVFVQARFAAFHRRLLERLLPSGAARLYLLERDGAAVAALYNLRHGSSEFSYQSGMDPAEGKYSPVFVADSFAIEQAIASGLKAYDFLRGKAGSYKQDYACDETPMFRARIFSNSMRGRVLSLGVRIMDRLRARRMRSASQEGTNGEREDE